MVARAHSRKRTFPQSLPRERLSRKRTPPGRSISKNAYRGYLQLSAPRYYSPEMGRWPSRDPLGEHWHPSASVPQPGFGPAGAASLAAHSQNMLAVPLGLPVEATRKSYVFVHSSPVDNADDLDLQTMGRCKHPDSAWKCGPCNAGDQYGFRQGIAKRPNGCSYPPKLAGPPSGDPDNPTGQCSFLGVCNRHDCCYGTCGSDKFGCDAVYCTLLRAKCRQCASRMSGWRRASFLLKCNAWAGVYCAAVVYGGGDAYDENQRDHCDPCICCNKPQPISPPVYPGPPKDGQIPLIPPPHGAPWE